MVKDKTPGELVACRCCGAKSFREIWNWGSQPLCFDYRERTDSESAAAQFQLGVGECQNCAVIQLSHPVPAKSLVPRLPWIKNKEPEGHLPRLASDLALVFTESSLKVLLVSNFDETLGRQLKEKMSIELTCLDPSVDLDITQREPGQALIQKAVTDFKADSSKSIYGKFDLVICCRMLEHAHQTRDFVAKLKKLLNSGGRLLLEIPESSKSLLQGDVGMLWEEHTNYFTQHSIKRFATANSLTIEKTWVYEYPQEDALAVLLKPDCRDLDRPEHMPRELGMCVGYTKKLSNYVKASMLFFEELKRNYGEIVILGAGHRAIMFINLLQIADFISAVIDDDERKQGLFIPGTQIPIDASSRFSDGAIGACLFAIGIESEVRLMKMLDSRFDRSMKYYSISPDSPLALPMFQ